MVRPRKVNRDKAFEIYIESKAKISTKEIAEMLGENTSTVNWWRTTDEWDVKLFGEKNKVGAPEGNLNGLKHGNYCDASKFFDKGFLAKYIPTATKNIIKDVVDEGVSGLDMLWDSIVLLYASIIRSQKIMYVKNQNDLTKEVKRSKIKTKTRETEKTATTEDEKEFEYELQFAWDKQERFIKSQSSAMSVLNSMIKDYEELLHKNWDFASEEQKLRIEALKAKIVNNEDSKEDKIDKYLNAIHKEVNNDN